MPLSIPRCNGFAYHLRRSRYRLIPLAFAAILSIIIYLSLFQSHSTPTPQSPFEASTQEPDVDPFWSQDAAAPHLFTSTREKVKEQYDKAEQVTLDLVQELAAVSNFLSSLTHNRIPEFIDPSRPIDPQLVLDFDTRSPRASAEVQQMMQEVWSRNPVFLYSKVYSPTSREVKSILAILNIHPPPMTIDIDIRDDADVLEPLISRLTASASLPVLLVGGKNIGSVETIRTLAQTGELRDIITASGASIGRSRRGKHRRRES